MSLPIKETPVLTGKDAARFIKRMHNETKPITKKEQEDYKRAKKIYEKMKSKGMGDL
jgi:hypothetical protein